MKKLAIDIGNTTAKWGVFVGKKLQKQNWTKRFSVPFLQRLVKEENVSHVILSSTKHLSKKMQTYFLENGYLILSHDMNFPFKFAYKTIHTLGKDRIAGIAGAWSQFPMQNSMVIDAGTCITYDLIRKDGVYVGGNITPGINMRLKAMHEFTDLLPQVRPSFRFDEVGTDTESAMQVGAEMGTLKEVEGFIKDYKKKFRSLNILLTGGDAHFFVNYLKIKIFVAPNLVLQGLNEILDYNEQLG